MNTPKMPAPEKKWFYANAENQPIGPMSVAELRQLAEVGTINPSTFVIEEGGTEWKTYGAIATPPVPSVPPLPTLPTEKKPLRWPAVVGVLVCYPVGLIALWLSKGYSRAQKWTMTGISVTAFGVALSLQRPGFIFLAIVSNGLLFIWWGEKLGAVWKFALSVLLCLFFLPPAFVETVPSNNSPALVASPVLQSRPTANVPPPSREEKPPRSRVQLKESFRLGNFTYKILGTSRQTEIGGGFSHLMTSPGAVFFLVNYKITNESNKTETVMSDDFVLKDSKGREFRPSSKALTALTMSEPDRDFILSELQPGLTKQTITAFEIPVSALEAEVVLIVPEKGWGAGRVEVLLKK